MLEKQEVASVPKEVAYAENAAGPHNEGRPSAAPHHMVAGAFGARHHVVIHYVVTSCFFGIGLR